MDDSIENPGPDGMLASLDPGGGALRGIAENVTCPNGLGWNAASTKMFWAESASGSVYVYDYDLDTGIASNQRVFFHLEPGSEHSTNVPDGLTVDEEDHIWLAVWGGSEVLRISPQGVLVGAIELPTRFVTCATFAGTDLYITTATESNPAVYPQSARHGGNVFKCPVGVRGLPRHASRPIAEYKIRDG